MMIPFCLTLRGLTIFFTCFSTIMKLFQFVVIPIKTISSGAGSRVSRGIRIGSEAHEEQRRRKVDETAPALPTHFYCQIGAQLGPVYQHGTRLFSGRQSSHVLLAFH